MAEHPIIPPPKLILKWMRSLHGYYEAARWGADIELEACVEWLGDAPVVYNDNGDLHPGSYLRDARRPKSPSLKEQALIKLGDVYNRDKIDDVTYTTIRLALEALDD